MITDRQTTNRQKIRAKLSDESQIVKTKNNFYLGMSEGVLHGAGQTNCDIFSKASRSYNCIESKWAVRKQLYYRTEKRDKRQMVRVTSAEKPPSIENAPQQLQLGFSKDTVRNLLNVKVSSTQTPTKLPVYPLWSKKQTRRHASVKQLMENIFAGALDFCFKKTHE